TQLRIPPKRYQPPDRHEVPLHRSQSPLLLRLRRLRTLVLPQTTFSAAPNRLAQQRRPIPVGHGCPQTFQRMAAVIGYGCTEGLDAPQLATWMSQRAAVREVS